jgi:hypothetical protein
MPVVSETGRLRLDTRLPGPSQIAGGASGSSREAETDIEEVVRFAPDRQSTVVRPAADSSDAYDTYSVNCDSPWVIVTLDIAKEFSTAGQKGPRRLPGS